MNWILVGLLLGSQITSTHETEEACLGRKAVLSRIKEVSPLECHQLPTNYTLGSTSSTRLCLNNNGYTSCK